jgi:hypothetical protein
MSIILKVRHEERILQGPAFFIPAAIAALGAGTQYVDTKKANERQSAATTQSIINQQNLQTQGRGIVDKLTRQVAQNTPDQLAKQATGDYVNVLRRNAAGTGPTGSSLFGPTSSLAPNVNGNARYTNAVAGMGKDIQDYGTQQATQMGNIDAAVRQRQNEGLAANTAGTNLNLLGAQSATQDAVDRLRTAAAGQENPWGKLVGSVLQGVGTAAAGNGLFASAPATAGKNVLAGVTQGGGPTWGVGSDLRYTF